MKSIKEAVKVAVWDGAVEDLFFDPILKKNVNHKDLESLTFSPCPSSFDVSFMVSLNGGKETLITLNENKLYQSFNACQQVYEAARPIVCSLIILLY